MSLGRLGSPSNEYRAVCIYAPYEGAPHCHAPADRHVLVEAPWGMAALPSCGDHAPVARACGALMEHAYAGICGLPGTFWDTWRNTCIIDDSGKEPEYRTQRTKGKL